MRPCWANLVEPLLRLIEIARAIDHTDKNFDLSGGRYSENKNQ